MASSFHRQQLREQVGAYVAARFAGDLATAFEMYDANGDKRLSKKELKAFLTDADVGSPQTRWAWTLGTLVETDLNGDGQIEWVEFEEMFAEKLAL
ncbi:EF-hand domain-containing protein [Limnoglobus roseus]|uniref:EF-hand domain-containing protein n=1 Tax=Limnoglobus roseus TaxID=2598579 RepID=A0A5C1AQM1_9BACT|nr:EF-hand domain-containing protein [Limnoglobus roseus]QEL19484.1 EF-hand domain-containing protein [Limnoglobus roseus]